MGLLINGQPLTKLEYNGLVATQDCFTIAQIDFSGWDDGELVITDTNGDDHIYNLEFDSEDRLTSISDEDGSNEIIINW